MNNGSALSAVQAAWAILDWPFMQAFWWASNLGKQASTFRSLFLSSSKCFLLTQVRPSAESNQLTQIVRMTVLSIPIGTENFQTGSIEATKAALDIGAWHANRCYVQRRSRRRCWFARSRTCCRWSGRRASPTACCTTARSREKGGGGSSSRRRRRRRRRREGRRRARAPARSSDSATSSFTRASGEIRRTYNIARIRGGTSSNIGQDCLGSCYGSSCRHWLISQRIGQTKILNLAPFSPILQLIFVHKAGHYMANLADIWVLFSVWYAIRSPGVSAVGRWRSCGPRCASTSRRTRASTASSSSSTPSSSPRSVIGPSSVAAKQQCNYKMFLVFLLYHFFLFFYFYLRCVS